MGYNFSLKHYYKVKADKEYPWPCQDLPHRTIKLFTSDILTKSPDGTYMKHTGLGTFRHVIPDEDVVEYNEEVHLRLL